MKKGDPIEFLRKKSFVFEKEIGQGGTGKTILVKDEILNEVFVCKKYSPFYQELKVSYFEYFIGEIKLLHKIFHKNIVRIFNYYLYDKLNTGYIIMEFIEGQNIVDFINLNPDKFNDIFIQVIEGFCYLEENKILHRDIRPENILVGNENIAKIIDFGFGKSIDFDNSDNSISLNWRYLIPDEFSEKMYDTKSEVYFVGKLFEEILIDNNDIEFQYRGIISKMILPYKNRISSFFEINREIVKQLKTDIDFSNADKQTYISFANNLMTIIEKMPYDTKYNRDLELIIKSLDEIYQNSTLEDVIQNNNKLLGVFLNGKFSYYKNKPFQVSTLNSMIKLLKSSSEDRKKIIINNLWERFDALGRYYENWGEGDDLPF